MTDFSHGIAWEAAPPHPVEWRRGQEPDPILSIASFHNSPGWLHIYLPQPVLQATSWRPRTTWLAAEFGRVGGLVAWVRLAPTGHGETRARMLNASRSRRAVVGLIAFRLPADLHAARARAAQAPRWALAGGLPPHLEIELPWNLAALTDRSLIGRPEVVA